MFDYFTKFTYENGMMYWNACNGGDSSKHPVYPVWHWSYYRAGVTPMDYAFIDKLFLIQL